MIEPKQRKPVQTAPVQQAPTPQPPTSTPPASRAVVRLHHIMQTLAPTPSVGSQSPSVTPSSTSGQNVHRLDSDPFNPVNMFVDPSGTVKHSQKSFVNDEGLLIPPGDVLDPVPHIRGKPADKEQSGLTSFSTAPQDRYAPQGRQGFMLTATATPQNSLDQAAIHRRIDTSTDSELNTPEGSAAKKDVGVPESQSLTQRDKLKAWSARDQETLLFPRQQIAQIHRLEPRKTAQPTAEDLAKYGLPEGASWIDVDEARAKQRGERFDRTSALSTHRKITTTPESLAKVKRELAEQRQKKLAAQIATIKELAASGKMTPEEAQRNLQAIERQQQIAQRRTAVPQPGHIPAKL